LVPDRYDTVPRGCVGGASSDESMTAEMEIAVISTKLEELGVSTGLQNQLQDGFG
jgi:hypothetical protein